MAVSVLNITQKRGDTRRHTFTIKDNTGAVVDISAWTLFNLAVTSDKAPVDETTLEENMVGAITTDGLDGRVSFIPTGTLSVAKHYYDTQALDANGEKITFAEGEYKVDQDRGKA